MARSWRVLQVAAALFALGCAVPAQSTMQATPPARIGVGSPAATEPVVTTPAARPAAATAVSAGLATPARATARSTKQAPC